MPLVKSQMYSILQERFTNIFMQNSRDFSVRPQQLCNFDHEVHNGVLVCLDDPEEWV